MVGTVGIERVVAVAVGMVMVEITNEVVGAVVDIRQIVPNAA